MEADVGGHIDAVGHVPRGVGFLPEFRERIVLVPQFQEQPLPALPGQVVPVEILLPQQHLVDVETPHRVHPVPECQKVHLAILFPILCKYSDFWKQNKFF